MLWLAQLAAPAANAPTAAASAPPACLDNGQTTPGVADVRINTYCKRQAIRDKYKGKTTVEHKNKMNQELMALYQAEGYNPMSGCFPILLQMPVFIGFYNVLRSAIELRQAPWIWWVKDLSAVDSTYVLVILMVVTMFIQQALTPTTADPVQKR